MKNTKLKIEKMHYISASLIIFMWTLANVVCGLTDTYSTGTADADEYSPQISIISEPCAFNRLCTCRSERSIVIDHHPSNQSLPEVTLQSDESTVRLIEVSCVQVPLSRPPSLVVEQLQTLQLVGCPYLHQLTAQALSNTSVTTLTVSRCGLRHLAGNSLIASRHRLTALDLSHNKLHSLPVSALRPLTAVQWLNIRGNRLQRLSANQLSASVGASLRTLLASENQISRLNAFGTLQSLQSLDLDHNQLRSLEGRALPISLHTLSLANNLLSDWPSTALNPLNQLRWLQLRGNHLKTLPDHWPMTTFVLDLLDLSHNLISSLAGNAFRRTSNVNSFTDYRRAADSVTLYTIEASKFKSDAQSNSFNKMNIQSDSTQTLPSSNITIPPEAQRVYVRHLQLDYNVIRQLDPTLFQALEVQRLGLSNNLLEELPASLFKGITSFSLQSLDLSFNQLRSICLPLKGLLQLQQLQLRNNRIRSISIDCFQSTSLHLTSIDLSANPLQVIPSTALQSLSKLRRLALEQCEIDELPANAFHGTWCKQLTQLSLSQNYILHLPKDAFKACVLLRELRLAGNPLWTASESEVKANLAGLTAIGRKLNILQLGAIHQDPSEQPKDELDPKRFKTFKSELQSEVDFSQSLQTLKGLEVLELNHNHLAHLDWSQFDNFTNLMHLDLEGNHLRTFVNVESNSQNSKKLRSLVLTNNKLDRLNSRSFGNLNHLTMLVLLKNRIEVIETNTFNRLPALTNLWMAHNRIQHVQTGAFGKASSLRWLQLQFNKIKQFSLAWFNLSEILVHEKPIEMNHETQIQSNQSSSLVFNSQSTAIPIVSGTWLNQGLYLNLSNNRISQLDFGESSLKLISSDWKLKINIVNLDLSHNQIGNFPIQFGQAICSQLIKLKLAFNKLNEIPVAALANCQNLQILNLKANKINRLQSNSEPLSDHFGSSIHELDLSDNQFESLDQLTPVLSRMQKLQILHLSNNRLKVLIESAFAQNQLTVLDLSHNQISSKQLEVGLGLDCFSSNASLDTLHLDHNPLTRLSPNLMHCARLSSLSAKYSELTQLDPSSFKLDNLLLLDLSGNHLKDALSTDVFRALNQLETLRLSHCDLLALPELPLFNLLHFHLNNNSISHISGREMSQLSQLRTLILANNRLTEVPKLQWKFLSELSELDLSGNPIELLDSNSLSDLRQLRTVDIRNLQLKYVDSRVFHGHSHLTSIKTSTYPYVRSFRLYDLLAKMNSLQKAWIEVEEQVLSHQIQWAFGSKLKELTISGKSLNTILPDAFLGLYHTSDFTLRITNTNITRLPSGLLRYFAETWHVTLDFRNNQFVELDENVLNVTLKDRHVEKEINPLQPTGGLMIQHNPLKCSCRLLWLRNWLRNWLKETRRTFLINPELYVRNLQLAHSFTCRLPEHSWIDSAQFIRWLHLMTSSSNSSQSKLVDIDSSQNDLMPILELNELALDCKTNDNYPTMTNRWLLFLTLTFIILF